VSAGSGSVVRRVRYRLMVEDLDPVASSVALALDLRYGTKRSYRDSAIVNEVCGWLYLHFGMRVNSIN